MTSPEPKSADLIATDPTTVLPWEFARAILADTRLYWLATVHPTGRPPRAPSARRLGSTVPSTAPQPRLPARAGTWPPTPDARSRPDHT